MEKIKKSKVLSALRRDVESMKTVLDTCIVKYETWVHQYQSFENLQSKLNDKFYFVNQIGEMFSSLLGNVNYGETPPTFSITCYGQTLNIIDFSLFMDYRIWLHGIILAISWFLFIRRLFNKLPGLIGGV